MSQPGLARSPGVVDLSGAGKLKWAGEAQTSSVLVSEDITNT